MCTFDTALRFCFKKRGSLNLKPRTQALIYFEGCSAAGQHVLVVLPTGFGKIGQIYEQLLPNMSEIGMFQCSEVEEAGSITIVVLPLSAPALQISGLNKSEAGPLLFLLQCETRTKEQTET